MLELINPRNFRFSHMSETEPLYIVGDYFICDKTIKPLSEMDKVFGEQESAMIRSQFLSHEHEFGKHEDYIKASKHHCRFVRLAVAKQGKELDTLLSDKCTSVVCEVINHLTDAALIESLIDNPHKTVHNTAVKRLKTLTA